MKGHWSLSSLPCSVHQGLHRLGVAGDSSCMYALLIVLVTASYDNHLLMMRCMSDLERMKTGKELV